MKRLALLSPLALTACVSLGGVAMKPDAVQKGQRTVVIVYTAPGPMMHEVDSNIMEAAKVIPGLSLIMGATQSQRDKEASVSLQRQLGDWQPVLKVFPALYQRLRQVPYPGTLQTPAEAALSAHELQEYNRAGDINDWLRRTLGKHPEHPVPRDYSKIVHLRDALILEVDFAPGAPSDGKGNYMPTLNATTELIRAADNAMLWRHETLIEDKAGEGPALGFRREPQTLIARYEAMIPQFADDIARALAANLTAAGMQP